jgi:hypothetical protein
LIADIGLRKREIIANRKTIAKHRELNKLQLKTKDASTHIENAGMTFESLGQQLAMSSPGEGSISLAIFRKVFLIKDQGDSALMMLDELFGSFLDDVEKFEFRQTGWREDANSSLVIDDLIRRSDRHKINHDFKRGFSHIEDIPTRIVETIVIPVHLKEVGALVTLKSRQFLVLIILGNGEHVAKKSNGNKQR